MQLEQSSLSQFPIALTKCEEGVIHFQPPFNIGHGLIFMVLKVSKNNELVSNIFYKFLILASPV